jgi:hypothetical protein
MKKDEIKNALINSVNTLNTVDVKGEDNMNHLLGVILLLKQVIPAIDMLEEVKPDGEG